MSRAKRGGQFVMEFKELFEKQLWYRVVGIQGLTSTNRKVAGTFEGSQMKDLVSIKFLNFKSGNSWKKASIDLLTSVKILNKLWTNSFWLSCIAWRHRTSWEKYTKTQHELKPLEVTLWKKILFDEVGNRGTTRFIEPVDSPASNDINKPVKTHIHWIRIKMQTN